MLKGVRSCLFFLAIAALVIQACDVADNYLGPDGPKWSGSFAPEPPSFFDGTLRVVSFNIKFSNDIEQAIKELKRDPKLSAADLLLLQEMDEIGVERIARELKYNFVYYPATLHPQSDRNFGNAILSKWPLKDERKVLLPGEVPVRKTRRIAVFATAVVDTQEICVGSAHTATFWLPYNDRIRQVETVAENIPDNAKIAVIGGDFNSIEQRSISDFEKIFASRGLTRASKGLRPTAGLGPIRKTLDHIFTRGVNVVAKGKAKKSLASDHLAIWVDLQFE